MYDEVTKECVFLKINNINNNINNNNNNTNKHDTFNSTLEIFGDLDRQVIWISYILLSVFVLTSNLMMIYGFYKTSRPFTNITKLFIYLSLVDIACTMLFVTYTALLELIISLLAYWVIYFYSFLLQFFYILGLSIFATISFLRYWSIKKPLHSINGNQICIALIVQAIVCGVFVGGLMTLFFFAENYEKILELNYAQSGTQFLAVLFVLIVNIISYKKLKSMKKNSGLSDNVVNTSDQRQKTLSEANTSLLYITTFYILCPIPTFIVNLLDLNILFMSKWGIYLFRLTYIFTLSNTGINSLIVILRTKNLCRFYRKKCCFPKAKRSSKNRGATELAKN